MAIQDDGKPANAMGAGDIVLLSYWLSSLQFCISTLVKQHLFKIPQIFTGIDQFSPIINCNIIVFN